MNSKAHITAGLIGLIIGSAQAADYSVQTTQSRDITQSELSSVSNNYRIFKAGDAVNAFVTISDFDNSETAPKVLQANWYHCGQLIYQQSKELNTIKSHYKRGLHHAWFWINSVPEIAGTGRVDIFADNQPVGSAQYQVLNRNGQSVNCQGQTSPAAINDSPHPIEAAASAANSNYVLQGDALFHFNGSSSSEMYRDGAAQIQSTARQIAAQYPSGSIRSITVTGYTDYLGNDAYNQALSARRAETVKQILIENGLPAYLISTQGGGESHIKECSPKLARPALKECLAPNRRVEISVSAQ